MATQDEAEHASGLTTVGFWNEQWTTRLGQGALSRALRAADFGLRGSFLRTMDRYVPISFKGKTVCELGGALSDRLVDIALHRGACVTAIDYSPVGIAETQEMFAARKVHGKAILADIFKLDAYAGSFDVVTHWGLMEHFETPSPVLEVSAALLKPDGYLVFTVPNLKAYGVRLWKSLAPANFRAHTFHTDVQIETEAKLVGLEIVRRFHCGPPLVRMAPPERRGLVAFAANIAHSALLTLNWVNPGIYTLGSAKIANTRGFVFKLAARN